MSRFAVPVAVLVLLLAPLAVFFSVLPFLYLLVITTVALFALVRRVGDSLAATPPPAPAPPASSDSQPRSAVTVRGTRLRGIRALDWLLGVVMGIVGAVAGVGFLLAAERSFQGEFDLSPYPRVSVPGMESRGWAVLVVAAIIVTVFLAGVVRSRRAKKCWATWSTTQWVAWLVCVVMVCGLIFPRVFAAGDRDDSLPAGGQPVSCLLEGPGVRLFCR